MKKISLADGIASSALGFGCAPILGSIGSRKAKYAVECAIANGITHFDLARSYGYGEAEQFVGKLLKKHRSQVVLATKFGIKANWKSTMLSPAKPLLRLVRERNGKKGVEALQTGAKPHNNISSRFHDHVFIDGKSMRKSLEHSLRALKTDVIDVFFLHEPQQKIERIDDVLLTAQKLKNEGKIRAFGLAYMRHQEPFHISYLNSFDILQFDNSPGAYGYEEVVANRGSKPNVLFSPLRGGSPDLKPSLKLKKLFADFPCSVVLCSMFNEQHLKENIALLD